MRLQLAIDYQPLDEAERLVGQVRDLIDIVEVGTPLIIREGVRAVARLSLAFPELTVLADLKIADGGHFEAALGFGAGARLVTVLATAADTTVRDAVRAAGECAGDVVVDLMGVRELARRAAECEALGAHFLCLHTPVDVQSGDEDAERRAIAGLQQIKGSLRRAGTAVAGGITPRTARSVAILRPDIVVVGSAITRAADPRLAAAQVRAALGGERRS